MTATQDIVTLATTILPAVGGNFLPLAAALATPAAPLTTPSSNAPTPSATVASGSVTAGIPAPVAIAPSQVSSDVKGPPLWQLAVIALAGIWILRRL